MLTAQDIKEKTFEKAVFGGYDMGTVDNFLDEIANDMALMQRENAVLKGKMKVLVEKIEEYRSNEDALRLAILSAQKMGCMIEKEAQDKSDAIIAQALAEADKITENAKLEVQLENARLSEAKQKSTKFIESMNLICRSQSEFLEKLSALDFVKETQAQAAPYSRESEIHETVKSIEETVIKAAEEPPLNIRPTVTPEMSEQPTRAFNAVPDDDLDGIQYSFESIAPER